MTVLPAKFGLPISLNYKAAMDVNLQRTAMASGWQRHRRKWLHNPSVFEVTFRMSISLAGDFIAWLRWHGNDTFELPLLHGNNALADCGLTRIEVKRMTGTEVERLPKVDQVLVSFQVETLYQVGYSVIAHDAQGTQAIEWPSTLPLPLAEGFTESHSDNGVTQYQLTFRLNTRQLALFLQFAGGKGLRWFKMHWPVTNVGCGDEYIRFTGNPSMSLVAPDTWEVSIKAETMPAFLGAATNPDPPSAGVRTYDSAELYNNPLKYEG